MKMMILDVCNEILKIQKLRRVVSYAGFYCFTAALTFFYTNNTTRAGFSRGDQFYASYPAGTELLTDTAKLYKAALGNCYESEDWGPVEFCIMAKHFERQGKSPYVYHSELYPRDVARQLISCSPLDFISIWKLLENGRGHKILWRRRLGHCFERCHCNLTSWPVWMQLGRRIPVKGDWPEL